MVKKIAVITGAGSGLGASLAKKYAEDGYHVCLLGRTEAKLERTTRDLSTEDHSIFTVDVSSKREVSQVFDKIKENLGTVDVLVNNAGVGVFDLAENLSEEAVHQMIDINLKGTIFCTQEVLADMKEKNSGSILNIVSTAGLAGKKTETVYCASKYGMRGFHESLLVELEETDIHVFGAYMGGMKTEFWDGIFDVSQATGLMEPEDVADIIFHNAKIRKNLNVDQVVIKNH
ncbi:SDR family oxidoreductase [Sporosarcina sp. G11-34]|uniref:SDR family oxidoreductase n=1 Tax=Sporosarcina sp. G11-34 TaxID=2849605 RepID=UPI0022A931E5|nr:SDR family oxidoreductase [Sporosarcina sp. G11-34]MCZ2259898.1 SDR family oxidoreductase [Sporosarcina sp. G11-34]